MKMKKLLLLPALLLTLSVGNVACSYHNDDNPNEYPDPQPEPEPEPQEENPSLPLWIPIGAGAVLLGGGTAGAVLAVRKRRNLTR